MCFGRGLGGISNSKKQFWPSLARPSVYYYSCKNGLKMSYSRADVWIALQPAFRLKSVQLLTSIKILFIVHEKKFNQWNPRPGQRGLLILPAQAARVSLCSKAKGPWGAAHSVSSLINRTKLQRSVGPTQTDVSAKLPIMIWSLELLH